MFTDKQIAIMKNDKKFMDFCQLLVDTKGNPTSKQMEDLNLPFELFLKMADINSYKLYNIAKQIIVM